MPESPHYRSAAEIEDVVRRFESCEYRCEEFVHARHVAVAAWYCLQFGGEQAGERMRAGLHRFVAYHGKSGYHETITDFWLRAIAAHVRELCATREPVYVVNEVVEALGDKNLVFRHYSREKIASPEAKASRTEPDLVPLPF
ncbi:MAG TPA: hypothetical protein VLY23_08380 [Candidatus Acidoferrum sp.]|nr:hypothetical protein [Candidatus Acidoferrum sp.]